MKNKVKRLLLYPAGLAQKEAFEEAKSQGLYIVTMDGNPGAPMRKLADEFIHVDPSDTDSVIVKIKDYLTSKSLDGALLVGSDLSVTQASICALIGSRGIDLPAAKLTVDKLAMKETMSQRKVPIPAFYSIQSLQDLRQAMEMIQGQMVLKPNDNCGARGVIQVSPEDDLEACFNYAYQHRRADKRLIAESFVPGLQISIEALVVDSKIFVTGIADRNYEFLQRYSPNIIENGADMPTRLNKQQQAQLVRIFSDAVHALGINNSVAKGDMIFSTEGPIVVEIAGRMSGGKFASKLVPLSNGINLLRAAIHCSLGEEIDPTLLQPTRENGVAVRYLFPEPGHVTNIIGEHAARSQEGVIELVVNKKQGDIVHPIQCHTDRCGWVVARGTDRQSAIQSAQAAIDKIKIVTEPEAENMNA